MRSTDFVSWLKENHSGEENAVNAKRMRHWGSPREIRFMVHDLRLEGHPICSGQTGYFYANKESEVRQTLGFLISMHDDLQKVIAGLRFAASEMG